MIPAPHAIAARRARAVAAVLGMLAAVVTTIARADDEPEAFARVVVDAADLRSGPGVSYRVISTVHRGETLALDRRQGGGFWLRVVLPDGRAAYALGDDVQPFAVRPGEPDPPSRPGVFGPPPLEGARGGLAIVGGVLAIPVTDKGQQAFGYMELRPSLVLHKTITLDGFVADALTADGSQLFYGGGVTVHLAPTWWLSPFVGIGGGGLSVLPNSDSFVLKRDDLWLARAGGGFLFMLPARFLVRLEVTNLTLFKADAFKNAQTYSGGFGVYF
jgi:hypothetical protein